MTHKDLISSYLESRATKVHMDDLRDEQKTALGRAVFIVSQSELNAFPELKQNTEFLRFANLFSEIEVNNRDEKLIQDLNEKIKAKLSHPRARARLRITRYEKKILGPKYQEYKYLSETTDPSKQPLSEKLIFSVATQKKQSYWERLEMARGHSRALENDFFLIDKELFAGKLQDTTHTLIEHFIFLILNPNFSTPHETFLNPCWQRFPLKWLLVQLTVQQTRRIFAYFKKTGNIDAYISQLIKKEPLKNLARALDDHFVPYLAGMSPYLHESIHAYEHGLYVASTCTSLPLIEGILWAGAEAHNAVNKNLFESSGSRKSLKCSDGTTLKDYTIGDLLKKTEFGKTLDTHFIKYFCEELYAERNPILHGRYQGPFDQLNAEKKILAVKYLSITLTETFKAEYHEFMDVIEGSEAFSTYRSTKQLTPELTVEFEKVWQEYQVKKQGGAGA